MPGANDILTLIYRAFLAEEASAFHWKERADWLQGGCSQLKGIPQVSCLDLHRYDFTQTSSHMCKVTPQSINSQITVYFLLTLKLCESEQKFIFERKARDRERRAGFGNTEHEPNDSGYERMCKPGQALCAHLVFSFYASMISMTQEIHSGTTLSAF